MTSRKTKIVVIGVGQTLRGDDAAGVIAVQTWQTQYPHTAAHPEVRVEIEELPGVALIELLSGAERAVIVDAVDSGSPAGTLHLLTEQQLAGFESVYGSAHGIGVAEALQLGRTLNLDDLPEHLTIAGIAAEQFEIGSAPSAGIATNLPQIAAQIEKLVRDQLASLSLTDGTL